MFLNCFSYLHNIAADKFQSISFCHNSNVEIIDYHHITGISIINYKKTSFSSRPIKIVLLYRKNNATLSTFYRALNDILQLSTVSYYVRGF